MKNMMSLVRNSNSSKSGLTAKRPNRWLAIGLTAIAVFLAGCKDNSDPFVTPGTTDDPHWEATVENNLSASMTLIVKVSFTEQEGTLAAFMDDVCCEVGTCIDGLYHLYITPAADNGEDIQLRFYSPELKRVFVTTENIPFRNNDHLGTIAAPCTPAWKVME
jgi:hypothetical protein